MNMKQVIRGAEFSPRVSRLLRCWTVECFQDLTSIYLQPTCVVVTKLVRHLLKSSEHHRELLQWGWVSFMQLAAERVQTISFPFLEVEVPSQG